MSERKIILSAVSISIPGDGSSQQNVRSFLVSGGDGRARVDEGEDGVGAARARRPHERLAAVVVLHVDARAVAQEPAEHCDGFDKKT